MSTARSLASTLVRGFRLWTRNAAWSQPVKPSTSFHPTQLIRSPAALLENAANRGGGPAAACGSAGGATAAANARRLFVGSLLRRVTNTQAANLRRRAATQLSSGNPAPFFALVGISLASSSGVITKQDELDCVCAEIRRAASKTVNKKSSVVSHDVPAETEPETWSLKDFEFGP